MPITVGLTASQYLKIVLKRPVMILMKGNFLGCEMKGAGLPRPRDSNSDGGVSQNHAGDALTRGSRFQM